MMLGLTVVAASAAVITPEQALTRALGDVTLASVNATGGNQTLIATQSLNGEPAVYVFANGENKGYMILSADDQAAPVLGFCDQGTLTTDKINPTMQWWLNQYAEEIQWLRQNPNPVSFLPPTKAAAERNAIAPLCKTKWDQDGPYNNLCPKNGTKTTYSGCVATAMAQIMAYHKYPKTAGNGRNSVTYNGTTYEVNFNEIVFDWDNMLDEYDNNATDAQKEAVAQLMYACGVSVSMSYGTGASSANTYNAGVALYTNFDYDGSVTLAYRDHYTYDAWVEYVYNQLANVGPVQYSGRNDSGHSFVCDGYLPGDFFHINWGWSGVSDGYYRLTALDPDTQGIGGSSAGYNSGCYIVSNIRPNQNGATNYLFKANGLGIAQTEANQGDALTNFFTGGYWNYSMCTAAYAKLGSVVEKADGTIVEQKSKHNFASTGLGFARGKSNMNFDVPSGMEDGYYRVYPAWTIPDEDIDWTPFKHPIYLPQFVTMKVEGEKCYFSLEPISGVKVTVDEFVTPVIVGHTLTLDCTAANQYTTEYMGQVYVAILSEDGKTTVATGDKLFQDVLPGESNDFIYTTTLTNATGQTLAAGNYNLAFADANGALVSELYPVVVEAEGPNMSALTLIIENDDFVIEGDPKNFNRSDITFTITAKATGSDFLGRVRAVFFAPGATSSSVSLYSPTVYIKQNETKTFKITGSRNDLEMGAEHRVLLYVYRDGASGSARPKTSAGATTATKYVTIGQDRSAVESIEADGQVVARELYNLNGVKVSNPAAGLYIERTVKSDGTIETKKVSVK